MNQANILGTLTRDVELKDINGTTLAQFSIAHNKRWKDKNGEQKEKVSFIEVKAWGVIGTIVSKYFHKGSKILISGELEQESWEKDGKKLSKIIVNLKDFDFIDSMKKSNDASSESSGDSSFSDEDVPF